MNYFHHQDMCAIYFILKHYEIEQMQIFDNYMHAMDDVILHMFLRGFACKG